MATRVIETDKADIAQSHFKPDATCSNLDCDCHVPSERAPVTITTTAEVDGDIYNDWQLYFCSLDCFHIFLGESFPITDSPSRTPSPGSSVRVFKPDV